MSNQSLSQISQLSGCNNWAATLPCLLPLYYNNDYNNYHDDDHYADFNNDCAVSSWRPIYLALCQSLFTAICDTWLWHLNASWKSALCIHSTLCSRCCVGGCFMRLSAVLGEEFSREVISTEIHTWLQTHTSCAEPKGKAKQGKALLKILLKYFMEEKPYNRVMYCIIELHLQLMKNSRKTNCPTTLTIE